jgi:hypothetical protein
MIQERIKQVIEQKGLTKYKFYQITGLSNGFLDKKGAIGSDKCEQIISVFPEIDAEWLLTGRGSMLKHNGEHIEHGEKLEDLQERITELKDSLKDKDRIIKLLEAEIASLTRPDKSIKTTKSTAKL